MSVDPYEVALAVAGVAALLAAWLSHNLDRLPVSLPIVLVGLGLAAFTLPLGLAAPDPRGHLELTERLTELGVLVALMGTGLKIDRPVGWKRWATTWRMLGIAMPLTIVFVALFGWWALGLPLASAMLLGAVLAPTDPVLASDVQVGEPSFEHGAEAAEDDVRFTLTSEGGLNDALAFPFVYAAIHLSEESLSLGGTVEWLAIDLGFRVVVGVVVGLAVGRALAVVAFRAPEKITELAESRHGFVAVAATLLAYGLAEIAQGYGFLAVFVAAVTLRSSERRHEYHGVLHTFAEEAEQLMIVGLLLLFGGALAGGLLDHITWQMVALAAAILLVVRPLSGIVALAGSPLESEQRWAIAFFGVRGIGSLYYLAYADSSYDFGRIDALWTVTALVMLGSVVLHGLTATPAMQRLDLHRLARIDRRARRVRPAPPAGTGPA